VIGQSIKPPSRSGRLQLHYGRVTGAAVPTKVQTLLDSRNGKRIRIMRCTCGEQTWSEEP